MKKNQTHTKTTEDQTEQIIFDTIQSYKPKTTNQLIKLVQEKTALAPEEITQLLVRLENEDKLQFTQKPYFLPSKFQNYVFSKIAVWYWIIIAVSFVTILTVFVIPTSSYPAVYVRYAFGIVSILLLPGYAFIRMLFPSNLPVLTGSQNMDSLEGVLLGIGMSLVLTMIVGLILNYTPWGITITPVTLSLFFTTVVFATAAILREYQARTQASKINI